MRSASLLTALLLVCASGLLGQGKPLARQSHPGVFVDSAGVLRWIGTSDEVSLFGANYTTPFAYAYRAHKRLGLSLKKAIDLDVTQMARLAFNAFRVHVWDREISDSSGNLILNEHTDLLDYLLSRLADRGISIILTPIAWWGTGWPEPDPVTQGFSQRYAKPELITSPIARAAERNYLRQFIEHVNPYRKQSYKTDPTIIAIEIINEPHHPAEGSAVTAYINEMAAALRSTGLSKPLFYNISENWSSVQANAVSRADIQGVSFQWYPTDLVHGRMLKGNYLMNVNHYTIPPDTDDSYRRRARIVYEFDAADVGSSYMYPAIARSFREAGMQFATMFSYDPSQIAWSNTEYPTHYMNLLYTPAKAISAMIAARVFRMIPRLKSFGEYPDNCRFGDFHVSFEDDLSELNSDTDYISSNTTRTLPVNPGHLKHIAGCGDSPLVRYGGTGAYFLDKLATGIWRLEIYPDVLWLKDPFEAPSMSRQAARLYFNDRTMSLTIPDLGEDCVFWKLTDTKSADRAGTRFSQPIRPGIYLVASSGVKSQNLRSYRSHKELFLDGLYIPPSRSPGISVINDTPSRLVEFGPDGLRFQIAGATPIVHPTVYIRRPGWRGFSPHPLKNLGGFTYAVADTPAMLQAGRIEYCVSVESGTSTWTYPEGVESVPGRWDFASDKVWGTNIMKPGEPLVVFDALRDGRDLILPHYTVSRRFTVESHGGQTSEETSLAFKITFLDESPLPFGVQLSVAGQLKPLVQALAAYSRVIVQGRASGDTSGTIGINLIMADGMSYSASAELTSHWGNVELSLSQFHPKNALILPDMYPQFLPRIWKVDARDRAENLDLRSLSCIQIIVDPSTVPTHDNSKQFEFEIQRIILER